ncbi:MAG: carboxypeptidase regulatory-like domain-containing protein [Bryobacteraceae bacterium]
MRTRAGVIFFVVFLPFAPAAYAQTATGQVNGTITDASGGAIAGAAVTLANLGTNVISRAETNATGYYLFLNVQPGSYTLTVEMKGFKSARVSPLDIAVNQAITQNVRMDVGQVTESVVVTAEAPLLQQSSSELGSVIGEEAVRELPLNGRNFTQLLILTPGAIPVSTSQGSGISATDGGMTGIPGTGLFKPSLHGQQNRSSSFFLDGIINSDFRISNYGALPIIDTVEEFKVQSHNEKTEYGGVLGGVVNLVSKSGTNQFHGSAWEFVRNNAFDARNPFTDLSGPPPPYRQNEFGAAAQGPVIRNKTFFSAGWESWRYTKPSSSLQLVPTSAELGGDFSQSSYKNPIYDPTSTVCVGSTCTRTPFPNNIISPSLMTAPASKAMTAFLKAYLRPPNLTGDPARNYIEDRPQTDRMDGYTVKIDHNFGDNDRLFGRLTQQWVSDTQWQNGTVSSNHNTYRTSNFGAGWDHIFSARLILDVRAGAMLKPFVFNQADAPAGSAPAAAAGFKNVDQYGGMFVSLTTPYTGANIGNRGLSYRGNPVANADASLTWIKANHSIKAGGQYLYQNRLQNNLFQQFLFNDNLTSSDMRGGRTGNSLASALLGLPYQYTGELPQHAEIFFRVTVWSGYLQDEWKIRPNLTLNWGVRYDYIPGIMPLNNRLSNAVDLFGQKYLLGASSIGACGSPFRNPCIPGGISAIAHSEAFVFTGKKSAGPASIRDNFGPRFGVAWGFARNTVLRAGYGLLYDTISARSQYAQNTLEGSSWPWTTGIGTRTTNNLAGNIYPGAASNPLTYITDIEGSFPDPSVPVDAWGSLSGRYLNDPNYKNTRSHQWNVAIERQFGSSLLVAAAYVGSHNSRLDYTGYANAAKQASARTVAPTAVDNLRAIPWATANIRYSESKGWSNYNALEMKVQKRVSHGLTTLLAYTWSKSMDTSSGWFSAENGSGGGSVVQNYFDPGANYGPSGYDIPQLLVWSVNYQLPFGSGRKFFSRGLAANILGGWDANYAFMARSGQPYTIVATGDIANISGSKGSTGNYGRPDLAGNPNSACTVGGQQWDAGTYKCKFNPSAFAIPSGAYGNLGKMTFRNEPFYNLDLSVNKNFSLGEGRSFQLRFEGFNVLNFQILGTPNTTLGQSNTGQVTGVTSTPRQLQLAAKIRF